MAKRFERRTIYKRIDVPWHLRRLCFYCGENADCEDHVPPTSRYHDFMSLYDSHPPILVPSCRQCNKILADSLQRDVYERFDDCKELLLKKLSTLLMYGGLWDEDSLEYAGFTGDLGKFSNSVIKQVEIAKERMEWQHWNVFIDGGEVVKGESTGKIKMDNKEFKSLDHVLEYGRRVYKIPVRYLEKVLGVVGSAKADYALSVCRTQKVTTEAEMNMVLEDLTLSESECILK